MESTSGEIVHDHFACTSTDRRTTLPLHRKEPALRRLVKLHGAMLQGRQIDLLKSSTCFFASSRAMP